MIGEIHEKSSLFHLADDRPFGIVAIIAVGPGDSAHRARDAGRVAGLSWRISICKTVMDGAVLTFGGVNLGTSVLLDAGFVGAAVGVRNILLSLLRLGI